ncbi:MAG: FHA domain-containing protein [Planctomycetia bacterium]|nr:FHA domain-containing protein [Planctomycetia bacterium]
MATLTFQVIDGVDKGLQFKDLATPITVGREEGNSVRLNDERISRFHAKIQFDQGDMILTDLESTNGTRVNGQLIHVHRLRVGDCVHLGRSVLLFGSLEEIAERETQMTQAAHHAAFSEKLDSSDDLHSLINKSVNQTDEVSPDFTIADDNVEVSSNESLKIGRFKFPPLPQKLSPSQAARLSEILDFLHRSLGAVIPAAQMNEDGTEVHLDFSTWQKLLQTELLLARYCRAITDPDH